MNIKEQIKKIPQEPGIYRFLDKKGCIIYIGKAGNLKKRVGSYFRAKAYLSPAKYTMVKKIKKIDWEVTDSEIEALLLEANLIKKHQPEYNVTMRDDKSYAYLKITTDDEWPTLLITRKVEAGGKYFGPFTESAPLRVTLKTLHKFFPYRKCKMKKGEVCLYGRLGVCPCNGMMDKVEYKKMIKELVWFLEGKKKVVLRQLKKELKELQNVHEQRNRETEKPAFAEATAGRQKNNDDGTDGDVETPARNACMAGGQNFASIREKTERLQWKILNLEKVLAHQHILGLSDKADIDLGELAKELGLKKVPVRIEGYDISNIYGLSATGSMVVFTEGQADKSQYRKFKIKTVKGIDDTGMLREVLERRFQRMKGRGKTVGTEQCSVQKRKNEDDWSTPDLIIVDGGRGQLNAALKVLVKYKLKIPVISLAKRMEEVYIKDSPRPLVLRRNSPALHLIQRVRDEAHRFAVSYHRVLRNKKGRD